MHPLSTKKELEATKTQAAKAFFEYVSESVSSPDNAADYLTPLAELTGLAPGGLSAKLNPLIEYIRRKYYKTDAYRTPEELAEAIIKDKHINHFCRVIIVCALEKYTEAMITSLKEETILKQQQRRQEKNVLDQFIGTIMNIITFGGRDRLEDSLTEMNRTFMHTLDNMLYEKATSEAINALDSLDNYRFE